MKFEPLITLDDFREAQPVRPPKRLIADRQLAPDEFELSRDEIQAEADALASRVLRTSANEAWERAQRGELEGTLFASKLARLFFLLGGYDRSK